MSNYVPSKIDLTPRRHHGYAVVLFIFGTLFPPLAVAARFGVGKDFWLNLLLTICGYIPGHFHNFYIQNIRNNKNHARTPKWIQKYGLVDISEIRRKERKSQWATRYNDRLPHSALEGQPYAEGQEQGSGSNLSGDSGSNGRPKRQPNGELWRAEDESYYNPDKPPSVASSSGGRWHYPANFTDVEPIPSSKKSKKKDKKDRWERTQDAYSIPADDGSSRKKKKKRSKNADTNSVATRDSTDFPEDAEGGLYGPDRVRAPAPSNGAAKKDTTTDEVVFNHEF